MSDILIRPTVCYVFPLFWFARLLGYVVRALWFLMSSGVSMGCELYMDMVKIDRGGIGGGRGVGGVVYGMGGWVGDGGVEVGCVGLEAGV